MNLNHMKHSRLFDDLRLSRGRSLRNRLVLAPLTNTQSYEDGTLSDDEYHWLMMRAAGGFGQIKTCAIAVEERGRGYPGQLGAWSDIHLAGLSRLASGIKAHGVLSCAQLSHSGPRSLRDRIGVVSDAAESVLRLSDDDVRDVIEHFVSAATRCEQAGFDGVEIHAAHGFLPAQFLSYAINKRDGYWGGHLHNRTRFIREILEQIRSKTAADFQLGLRLSPERLGLRLTEILAFAEDIMQSGLIDWLDMSLWDVFKEPEEHDFSGKSLLSWFADLERGNAKLGVAGNILDRSSAEHAIELGADYVGIGKAAILASDFPKQILDKADYILLKRPVSNAFLVEQGLGPAFIDYMRGFNGFVE